MMCKIDFAWIPISSHQISFINAFHIMIAVDFNFVFECLGRSTCRRELSFSNFLLSEAVSFSVLPICLWEGHCVRLITCLWLIGQFGPADFALSLLMLDRLLVDFGNALAGVADLDVGSIHTAEIIHIFL
jgi:hypothetical protein